MESNKQSIEQSVERYKVEFELFYPSQEVLDLICEGDDLIYNHEISPRGNELFDDNVVMNFMSRVSASVMEYLKVNFDQKQRDRCSLMKVFGVVGEALKNCYDHGPKDKNVLCGLFLGNKGVCYAFNDGGEYFKNEEIKKQYEGKIPITEFDDTTIKKNCQSGVNECIFPYSDFIEVDAEKGILYCVQLKKNIIAPEGECGDSYFYNRDKER